MLCVKVTGLPPRFKQRKLRSIEESLVKAVCSIEELKIECASDIILSFTRDMRTNVSGQNILIETMSPQYIDIPNNSSINRSIETRMKLRHKLRKALKLFLPDSKIQCTVHYYSHHKEMSGESDIG